MANFFLYKLLDACREKDCPLCRVEQESVERYLENQENTGGFASVRCRPGDLGRKGVVAYLLHVLGDGKRYKLNLRTDDGFDGVNYQAGFHPAAGSWASCRIASADVLPTWRGKPVADAPPLDTARVRQIGLMIADRQEGPFRLAVRSIAVEVA